MFNSVYGFDGVYRVGAAPRGRPFFHARERAGTETPPYGVCIAVEHHDIMCL